MDTLKNIFKAIPGVKFLWSLVKPAKLALVSEDIEIWGVTLTYTSRYRLVKGKWAWRLSKNLLSLPLGTDIELVDVKMQLPASMSLQHEKLQLHALEATPNVEAVLQPVIKKLRDGEEMTLSAMTRFDAAKYIDRKTVSSTAELQEMHLTNRLSHPLKQVPISLDVTAPHLIRKIEIEKAGADVSANRYVSVEHKCVRHLRVSDIPSTFPDGIPPGLPDGQQIDDISCTVTMEIDFEGNENIKIFLRR